MPSSTGLTRLGLRYVQWLVAERQISVAAIPDALTRRVNIYRLESTRMRFGRITVPGSLRRSEFRALTCGLQQWFAKIQSVARGRGAGAHRRRDQTKNTVAKTASTSNKTL